MAEHSFIDLAGLQHYDEKLLERLANPIHSYVTASGSAKNWYRIANASTSQTDASKPLHMQFALTAYNEASGNLDYYQRWFADIEVFGRNAGARIFGQTNLPFSQLRVLYENTASAVDASTRPAIDLYLNVQLDSQCTVHVEELLNSGWTFVQNGTLAASAVPSGYESRAVGPYAAGVNNAGIAEYAAHSAIQRTSLSADAVLQDNNLYRMQVLNCTNSITVSVPSTNSVYSWFLIKNANETSGTVTVHPSTGNVLFDGTSGDIVLNPGEYILLANAGESRYTILMDGRWKSMPSVSVTSVEPTPASTSGMSPNTIIFWTE